MLMLINVKHEEAELSLVAGYVHYNPKLFFLFSHTKATVIECL